LYRTVRVYGLWFVKLLVVVILRCLIHGGAVFFLAACHRLCLPNLKLDETSKTFQSFTHIFLDDHLAAAVYWRTRSQAPEQYSRWTISHLPPRRLTHQSSTTQTSVNYNSSSRMKLRSQAFSQVNSLLSPLYLIYSILATILTFSLFIAVHSLTDLCWKKCVPGKISTNKMDGREDGCMQNCVDRYMDSQYAVLQHLETLRGGQ